MDPTQPNMQPAEAPSYPPQVPIYTSNVADVPPSPAEVADLTQQGLTQDEMKAHLKELMDKVQEAYSGFNGQKTESNAVLKEQENAMLREIFDLLESYGVDASNVEEVNAFMEKIKQTDPELFQQIEKALSSMLGGETPPENPGQEPQENMNINPNEEIPQNI